MPLHLLVAFLLLPWLQPASARAQAVDSVLITWTAPADLPGPSAVSRYDVRVSTVQITDANFETASALVAPTPRSPGEPEAIVVRGLVTGRTYWLAIRSYDAAGNVSALSNVLEWTAPLDAAAPAAPSGLAGVAVGDGASVTLSWSAGAAPDLAGYSVYRTIDPAVGWWKLNSALLMNTTFVDTDPPLGMTRLYYAISASDVTGNESALSADVLVQLREAHTLSGASWRLLSAYPNPARVGAAVHLPIEVPANGTRGLLEILDAANQLVRHFEVAGGTSASTRVEWDGRNDHGALCAPGVYRVRFTAGNVHQSIRIARVP